MQRVSHDQGEAILDLVRQCQAVAAAWEQQEATIRARQEAAGDATSQAPSEKVAQEASKDYEHALSVMKDFYGIAEAMDIDTDILDRVLLRNLPKEVNERLHVSSAA